MTTERTARVAAPAALALFAVLGAVFGDQPKLIGLGIAGAISLLGAVMAWERTSGWPLAVLMSMVAGGIVLLGHGQSANLVWMGLCVAAGWVAATSSVAVVAATGALFSGAVVSELLQQTDEPGWFPWLTGTVVTLTAFAFARRLRLTVEQLREAQHQLAERSRAEERNRIAAEVHDVMGHALTVSLLHIGSARLALDEERQEAERALAEAERLTRQSLDEVRASVGLMRTDGGGQTAPLPDATGIPELVESFRRAGATVGVGVAGDLARLGPSRGLAAYRIVQEALTNATRHAPGEPVEVAISVDEHRATVSVRNDGSVAPDARPGSGLRSMSERAESVGGRVRVGTTEATARRGWHVEAVLPV